LKRFSQDFIKSDATNINKPVFVDPSLPISEKENQYGGAAFGGLGTVISGIAMIVTGTALAATGAGAVPGAILITLGATTAGLGAGTIGDAAQAKLNDRPVKENIPQGMGEIIGQEINERNPEFKTDFQAIGAIGDFAIPFVLGAPSPSSKLIQYSILANDINNLDNSVDASIERNIRIAYYLESEGQNIEVEPLIDLLQSAGYNNFTITEEVENYLIKPGDNLIKLSERFGSSVDKLLELNPEISNPDLIYYDDTLIINQKITIDQNHK
jgi:hypothetical protein